jgi:hypothetical protein
MTRDELLTAYAAGRRDFTSANLSGANLRSANLRSADLRSANLSGADLYGADLRSADLRSANLSGADLSGADLSGANLSGADLYGADLRSADLYGADLYGADLRSANLRSANLSGANLRGASLEGCDLSSFVIAPEGALRVYKKTTTGIAVLIIPNSAARVNAYGSRKCRAEFALVLEAPEGAVSRHDRSTKYVVGETVRPDSYDPDPRVECSHGIHFFLTRAEAEAY